MGRGLGRHRRHGLPDRPQRLDGRDRRRQCGELEGCSRKPLTTYDYTVVALDGAGHTSDAAALTVTTKADTSAPGRVRRVHVTHRHGPRITLAWAAAGDNVGVVRYRIYRLGNASPVAATTNRHVRFRAKAGARYVVRAFDAAGNRGAASKRIRPR